MQTVTTSGTRTGTRIESIDVLRGVVMILMALDHVRDFFGTADNPVDPVRASAALFFTRWITHVCAPTFFLLTGTGAYLARRRRSTAQLSRFLLARGIWLILLELTVLRCLGYQFNFDYHVTMLVILWALGWSMIALGGFVHLPVPAIAAAAVLMIAGHNLFDRVNAGAFGRFAPVWTIVHAPGIVLSSAQHIVFVAYPLIPWIGVTAFGYCLGPVFGWPPERRRRLLVRLGTALILAFVALRLANVYGDPSRWSRQASAVHTVLSFLNAAKYPPSLLFLMMTLGPALLFLGWIDRDRPRRLDPALVFGKVPLFYFMLHMPLIHLLAVIVCYARYGAARWMFESARLDQYPFTRPPGWGYSLPVVYAIWIGVVVALFPLCRWFATVKQRRDEWWLSYL